MYQKKNRLILIVSLLLIAGFVMTSLASYYAARSSLRSQIIKKDLPLTCDNIYSEIQRDLLHAVFISSFMANDTFLQDWILNGEKDTDRIARYLGKIQKEYQTFTSFFVSDRTRNYYHAKGILKIVKQENERDKWYFRVKFMETEYEINVDPDMANADSMTIFINYRVYDDDHNFIGATGVGLMVGTVKNLIRTYQKSYGRDIYFVDKKGKIILHGSNLANTGKPIGEINGIAAVANEILSGTSGSFSYKKEGKTAHLNTRYIPELDWYLLVEQTEEKAVREVLRTLLINLGICVVITIVVLTLTNLMISSYQVRLEKIATTDKLTGIYNRQAFDIVIHQNLKEIQRKEIPLSVILFDIDNFKQINDDFGHLTGDLVLKNIVDLSMEIIRASDVLCRWGGDEFLILLKDCSLEDAYKISEKIREAVQNNPVLDDKGRKTVSTISLGVAMYLPPEKAKSLFARVDKLLYMAKKKGRNRSEKG